MNRIFESFLNRSPSITSRRRQFRGSLLSDSLQTFEDRQLLTGAFLPADPAPAAAVSEAVESQGAAIPKFVSTLGPRDADNSFAQATALGDVSGDPTDGVRVSVLGKVKARTDVEDNYSFTVSGESGMYRISLSGLRRDVNMELLRATGPGTATIIASDFKTEIASESLDVVLEPGTYFIRTSMAENEKGTTRYQINVSNIGNSTTTALDMGTNFSGLVTPFGRVSSGDVFDVYKFTIDSNKTDLTVNWNSFDPLFFTPLACNITALGITNAGALALGDLNPLGLSNGSVSLNSLDPGDYYIVISADFSNPDPLRTTGYSLTVT